MRTLCKLYSPGSRQKTAHFMDNGRTCFNLKGPRAQQHGDAEPNGDRDLQGTTQSGATTIFYPPLFPSSTTTAAWSSVRYWHRERPESNIVASSLIHLKVRPNFPTPGSPVCSERSERPSYKWPSHTGDCGRIKHQYLNTSFHRDLIAKVIDLIEQLSHEVCCFEEVPWIN